MPGGGMENFIFRLGVFLSGMGHRVDVITTLSKGDWYPLISEFGLTPRYISKPRFGGQRCHALKIGLSLRCGGYDCIFLDNTALGQHAIPLLSKKATVIPVMHGDAPWCYSLAAKHSDLWNVAVAANSKVQSTLSMAVPTRPVACIPRGIDLPLARELEKRREFELPLRVLYVGRFTEVKGVQFLPEILSTCVANKLNIKVGIVEMALSWQK
jgi:glycosyltransferase involved in cell wall biosynthesis